MRQNLSARNKTLKKTSRHKARKLFARSRKKLIRYGLVTSNLVMLFAVVYFVTKAPVTQSSQLNLSNQISDQVVANPLDQLSSADIAVHVARAAGLPESTAVVNYADSVSVSASSAPADTSVVAKPQVVYDTLPSYRDIQFYTTKTGDTVSSIAIKFGVSSDSIRWSNGLSGNSVVEGKKLVLPPAGTNGIVHTVTSSDTPESLARKYATTKQAIISFNDAEVDGLVVGRRILIPDGTVTTTRANIASSFSYTFYGGGGSYSRGWCTDYASSRGGAPGGWGNAVTWAYFAARTPGWGVTSVPRVGSIGWTAAGWAGHVGVVDAVSEDGTMIKYSDMNGLAGWGRVGYSDWVPTYSRFQSFIVKQ